MTGRRTSPLSPHAPRLEKLLLMLSSNHDGEVVSAARAIGRTLQTAGSDWHDLAGDLLAAKSQTKKPHDHDNNSDWRVMRAFCAQRSCALSRRECDFIFDLKHWRGELTPKQRDWLTAIYKRLQHKAA